MDIKKIKRRITVLLASLIDSCEKENCNVSIVTPLQSGLRVITRMRFDMKFAPGIRYLTFLNKAI